MGKISTVNSGFVFHLLILQLLIGLLEKIPYLSVHHYHIVLLCCSAHLVCCSSLCASTLNTALFLSPCFFFWHFNICIKDQITISTPHTTPCIYLCQKWGMNRWHVGSGPFLTSSSTHPALPPHHVLHFFSLGTCVSKNKDCLFHTFIIYCLHMPLDLLNSTVISCWGKKTWRLWGNSNPTSLMFYSL